MTGSTRPRRPWPVLAWIWFLVLALAACGKPQPTAAPTVSPSTVSPPATRAPGEPAATPAPSPSDDPRAGLPLVIFLGDSLTAGYGLAESEAYPALLEGLLAARGVPVRVVNAGVSGDTSSGGLRRLPWLLRQQPRLVVVALGANDGLRGQPVDLLESNLRRIVTACREAGAAVLLCGMRVPPSLGESYAERFAEVYPRIAEELGVPLVPFLLEGVAGIPELNQADGIHPTAEGQKRIADLLAPRLARLLEGVDRPSGS